MAYNSAFNPDALPAHAEPEQAAQMLGQMRSSHPQSHAHSQPPPGGGLPPRAHPNAPHHQQTYPPASRPPVPSSNTGNRIYSPPRHSYGHGPRPMHPTQNRPPASSLPPRTPRPGQAPGVPASDNPQDLFPLFRAANASNTGSLSEHELGSALLPGENYLTGLRKIAVAASVYQSLVEPIVRESPI
ncbi:peflin [Coccidioides immitis RMSCC 3703]|uniref:Peflin n=1 Tax=Coccidioides immitis RMSCC 3703 TaxID=454286 RepID=A0A0J8U1E8_COCIT|nr:peflin [Coccidioides immitis RMSCC 3703]